MLGNDNPHEVFKTVWYEFYRYNPKDFVRNMAKLDYDYVKVPKYGHHHVVVYNPKILRLVKILVQ